MIVNKNTEVSIIIPAHNAEHFITKCLQSIQQQSFQNFQVLVVDNDSTDRTVEKVLSFVSTDKRFRLLSNSALGVSNARNLGLREVQSKFVTFVDADDFISNNHIQILMDSVSATQADMGVTGFSYETEDGNTLGTFSALSAKMHAEEAIRATYDLDGIQGVVWNKIFRKAIIDRYDIHFDPSIPKFEDHKFVVAYLVHCKKISCECQISYHYIKHPGSALLTTKTSLVQDLDVYLTIRQMIVDHGFRNLTEYVDVPMQIIVLNHYWHPFDPHDQAEAVKRMINWRFIFNNLFRRSMKNKLKFLLTLFSLSPYFIKRESCKDDAQL
ncbi:glycosyltransferase family 2 protein [Lacticaseibacillus paracasei]|uniref:glycosyltransferase family 2 protein n=1 Tax=Lacticaseibacillus paracasei TaxID=1597 RepID=UPI0007BF671C|nr:glycosyltransferase family 2 protein [Lacticaseibacillus paracasei]